jgi:hypothetical protein
MYNYLYNIPEQKLYDLDSEFNNRQLLRLVEQDPVDDDKTKKQRQKIINIDAETNEAIKDSRYLNKLNTKFNRIYKVKS